MELLFFSPILGGYEFDEKQAIEWGTGYSFCEEEPTRQSISNLRYIDTVQGDVDVYYCYGTDDYYFVQSEEN